MLKISVTPEISDKFKALLKEEDSEDAIFRIRESKVGGGCKSRIELRISLDEREDPDEEQEIQVDGIPFVVSNDVIDSYGLEYSIFVDDHDMPGVRAATQDAEAAGACCLSKKEEAC